MALIKCPDCGTEVSDKAEKCPKCSCPIAPSSGAQPQVIEQTGKKLKAQLAIGAAFLFFGIVFLFVKTPIGVVLSLIGLGVVIVTKISIWWEHR